MLVGIQNIQTGLHIFQTNAANTILIQVIEHGGLVIGNTEYNPVIYRVYVVPDMDIRLAKRRVGPMLERVFYEIDKQERLYHPAERASFNFKGDISPVS